jgi:hypothetical protein
LREILTFISSTYILHYLHFQQLISNKQQLRNEHDDAAGKDTPPARADRKIHGREQPLPSVPARTGRPDHDVEAALVLRRAAGGGHRRVRFQHHLVAAGTGAPAQPEVPSCPGTRRDRDARRDSSSVEIGSQDTFRRRRQRSSSLFIVSARTNKRHHHHVLLPRCAAQAPRRDATCRG